MGILKGAERRTTRRMSLRQVSQISEIRLSSEAVKVLDISVGGLLMECGVRLTPSSETRLRIVATDKTLWVPSRILRCHIATISKDGVVYRAAVAFNEPLSFIEEGAPDGEHTVSKAEVTEPGRVELFTLDPSFALNSW